MNDLDYDIPTERTDEDMASEHSSQQPLSSSINIDDIQMPLTIELDRLEMTIGQLKNLTVGSVITMKKNYPEKARLCYDNRTLGYGELVEVDGYLGLQITSLDIFQ